MKNFVVIQFGSRMNYAIPRILFKNGYLIQFYTDFLINNFFFSFLKKIQKYLLPNFIIRLTSRYCHEIPRDIITTFPTISFAFIFRKLFSKGYSNKILYLNLWSAKLFANGIIKNGLKGAKYIYLQRNDSLEILREAKKKKIFTILEQNIAPASTELKELEKEYKTFKDWSESNYYESSYFRELLEREKKEHNLADIIVSPSNYVKQAIISENKISKQKIRVIEYGVDGNKIFYRKIKKKNKLNILTVGNVSLRKGVQYTCQAAMNLSNEMNFRIIGEINIFPKIINQFDNIIDFRGQVTKINLKAHYEWADIFLLPSLCEGSATSTYEAMTHGLPVICTKNTGSVISNNKEGFIIETRNSNSIVEKLNYFNENRDKLLEFQKKSFLLSRNYTLRSYEDRFIQFIKTI
ncbi:RfaG Glycosyltransferase [Candidatus Pelagibacterales bacterium]